MAKPPKPKPPKPGLKFNDKTNSQYVGTMAMGSNQASKPALKFNVHSNSQYIGTA